MNGERNVNERASGPSLWRVIAGFMVWAVAFVVLYMGHALGCLYVPSVTQGSTVSAFLIALWLAHLALAVVLMWRSREQRRRALGSKKEHAHFMWRVVFLLDTFAAAAVFVTGLPLLAISACTP